jgi:hypothetical protein
MRRALATACLAALAACGCGSKSSEPAPAPGSASAQPPPREPDPGAAPSPAPLPEPGPASGGLPAACEDYRRTVARLAGCGDALPQATRDNLRAHFERQWTGWEKLPEPERRALEAICRDQAEIVKAAAAAACGW